MSNAIRLFHAESDADLARCFSVMVQLRPHLTLETFVRRVRRQQREGYRIAALEVDGVVRALAGYRPMEFLWCGRVFYIDDLITDAASRSSGYGDKVFGWVRDLARADGCDELHLDSGVHRGRAHRFYFRQGMQIEDFHFALKLKP
ncbi:MAG TPA: GNAT family N-acetyltransferase [Candidatus Didemnitutus sp.]|nr:GNAT family N-acetyltransferase [Candidatus Didemnitutus sp.]